MTNFNITPDTRHAVLQQEIDQLNITGFTQEVKLKQLEYAGAGASPEAQACRDAIDAIKAALRACADLKEEGN